MNIPGSSRRGRKSRETFHPVGAHMRRQRERLDLTLRDLAAKTGLGERSASFLSQLESGSKVPNKALARRLAEALRDDPRIYLAWADLGKRADWEATVGAVRMLAELLGDPRMAGAPNPMPSLTRLPQTGPPTPRAVASLEPPAGQAAPPAWLLVPEIEEGADPGDDPAASRHLVARHKLDPTIVAGIEPLMRPFAYRLTERGARRVSDVLSPGNIAVLTRRAWPIEPGAPCAVRLSGRTLLARVLWNGRQLLLAPGPGESDFIVLDAPDRTAVERLVAGRVVATLVEHT